MLRARSLLGATAKAVRRSAARVAARAAQLVYAGRAAMPTRSRHVVRLDDVRRRLELLVTAVYDRPIPIAIAERPRTPLASWWTDPFAATHLRRIEALATTDGERIQLPGEIIATDADSALTQYRLMAIEQAERIVRGTTARLAAVRTPIERDMYLIREGEVVDAAIARSSPGLRAALVAARAQALGARPALVGLTLVERAVEAVLRRSLSRDLTSREPAAGPSDEGSPDDSLEWARQRAHELSDTSGRYRGLAPVAPWGTVKTTSRLPHERLEKADELATFKGTKYGVGKFGHGTGKGGRQSSDAGQEEGKSERGKSGEKVPHADGQQRVLRPGAGDSTADVPEDSSVTGADVPDALDTEKAEPDPARASDQLPPPGRRTRRIPAPKVIGDSIEYPEWDWQTGDYRAHGAVVHQRAPDMSDDSWGNAVLARHGPLVRRLRERFERLRARRVRLSQQRDGDELDLAACVRAMVDQRAGQPADDRLYQAVRPARRGLAICLLIDISGSTDEWIDARRRVIDVEKVALLLASEALDALGDAYAILTFSGKGRTNVRMRTIKAFDETNGAVVRRRMAALEPEGYTRAGAAIRHGATLLEQQPAAHRLLLILSDGKPNDVDDYEGLNGLEDTRQAIQEARAQGVYPFCLTIDRQGQQYLGRIFGEAGHTVLRNPSQLPMALVKVVKHLVAT